MGDLLAALAGAWAAYSFTATLIGATGVLALVTAFVLTPYLPSGIRHALFFGGALVVGCAVYGQYEHARGAAERAALEHARALAAETARAAAAEGIRDRIAAQAAQDLAAERAGARRLQETLDALKSDPARDRVCVDRDLARRLRSL